MDLFFFVFLTQQKNNNIYLAICVVLDDHDVGTEPNLLPFLCKVQPCALSFQDNMSSTVLFYLKGPAKVHWCSSSRASQVLIHVHQNANFDPILHGDHPAWTALMWDLLWLDVFLVLKGTVHLCLKACVLSITVQLNYLECCYGTDWIRQRKLDDVHSYDSVFLPCSSVGVFRVSWMMISCPILCSKTFLHSLSGHPDSRFEQLLCLQSPVT